MRRITLLGAFMATIAFATYAIATAAQQATQPLDREFLIKAIACNQADIKMGELAESRSENSKVKQFADKLVKEHRALAEELTKHATQHKLAVLVGTEKETNDMIERLSGMRNDTFDREFLKTIIGEHVKAVLLFEAQSTRGADAGLKTLATTTLPALRSHLEDAKKLADGK